MAVIQLSTTVRNARLGAYEATIGPAPILRMYSGPLPADCAATATGDLLVEMTLPSDWLSAPAGGSVSMLGTWQDASADAAGKLGYYRILDAGGATCHEQGDITLTGGGGAMTVDNTDVAPTQKVTVTSFIRTDGNA